MELKFDQAGAHCTNHNQLLIEPYGIEIRGAGSADRRPCRLLIEPYGIEILQSCAETDAEKQLLIEPYGIEICIISFAKYKDGNAFNRTLWN